MRSYAYIMAVNLSLNDLFLGILIKKKSALIERWLTICCILIFSH